MKIDMKVNSGRHK